MADGNKTFIKVTNRMIYDDIQYIKKRVGKLSSYSKAHSLAIAFIIIILAAVIKRLV